MIYVVVGPTASGKSHLAEQIYHKLDRAVLINGDAYQIYKDMNIGTAKIGQDDALFKEYQLLDILTPDHTFSVMEYQSLIRLEIQKALDDNKDVIIVGGTGLYIRAALYDYDFVKEETPDDVSDLEALDNDTLHDMLTKLDEVEAAKIHKNNKKRMIRGISLIRSSGQRKSDLIAKQDHKVIYDNVKIFFINPDREKLYEKINNRVDEMFDSGWIDEVKGLLEKYDLSNTAKKAIGYEEIISYLNNELSLQECKEIIKKRTRNYAKRQITFFKHQFDSIIMYNNIDDFIKLI